MVDFEELGKETWDKTKAYRVEELWYFDDSIGEWDLIVLGRTEFLTSRKMRKMIEAVKGTQ